MNDNALWSQIPHGSRWAMIPDDFPPLDKKGSLEYRQQLVKFFNRPDQVDSYRRRPLNITDEMTVKQVFRRLRRVLEREGLVEDYFSPDNQLDPTWNSEDRRHRLVKRLKEQIVNHLKKVDLPVLQTRDSRKLFARFMECPPDQLHECLGELATFFKDCWSGEDIHRARELMAHLYEVPLPFRLTWNAVWKEIGFRWVSCWMVTGGNEGYYIHLELVGCRAEWNTDGPRTRFPIALGKVYGYDTACTMVRRICELLGA